jgi:thioesterase domain-containing protein/acyl carrier protein
MQLSVESLPEKIACVADDETGALPAFAAIKACFEHVLCTGPIAPDTDFFDLGGDSASAVELALEIETATGVALPMTAAFDAPTPAAMARLVESVRGRNAGEPVLLKQGSAAGPVFLFPGAGGAAVGLRRFALGLQTRRPVYGFDTPGLNGRQAPLDRTESLAAYFMPHLRALQPHGPYLLAGYSVGGLVAYEVAQRLRAQGEDVALVGLIDTAIDRRHYGWRALARIWARRARAHLLRMRGLRPLNALGYAGRHLRSVLFDIVPPPPKLARPSGSASDAGAEASRRYVPQAYDGQVVLLWSEAAAEYNSLDLAWRSRAPRLIVRRLRGDHRSAMAEDVASTSAAFSAALADVGRDVRGFGAREDVPGSVFFSEEKNQKTFASGAR